MQRSLRRRLSENLHFFFFFLYMDSIKRFHCRINHTSKDNLIVQDYHVTQTMWNLYVACSASSNLQINVELNGVHDHLLVGLKYS